MCIHNVTLACTVYRNCHWAVSMMMANHICFYVCMYIYIYIYICTYICHCAISMIMANHTHTHICVCVYIYIYMQNTHPHMYVYMHACISTLSWHAALIAPATVLLIDEMDDDGESGVSIIHSSGMKPCVCVCMYVCMYVCM